MKKMLSLVQLFPGILVSAMAFAGFRMSTPALGEVIWPEAPVMEEMYLPSETEEEEMDVSSASEAESSEALEVSEFKDGEWADGTYTGSAKGFGGTISVRVTIAEGAIESIEVTSHNGETPSFYQKAFSIVQTILAKQSPNVDTVSGATYTSNGIREAVKAALTKAAGGKVEETTDTAEETTVPETVVIPEGSPADGAYTGTALCEQGIFFHYRVTVKANYKNGKLKKLNMTTDDTGRNESYITSAWKKLKSALLQDDSGNVDTVSGATYTSNAIKKAYFEAYKQAVEANGGTIEDASEQETEESGSSETEKQETESDTEESSPAEETEVTETGLADGIYRVSALVDSGSTNNPNQRGQFASYTLSGQVKFEAGRLVSIEKLNVGNEAPDEEYDADLLLTEVASADLVPRLIESQNPDIDAVSGATCSSNAIIQLYKKALALAGKAYGDLTGTESASKADPETNAEGEGESSSAADSQMPSEGEGESSSEADSQMPSEEHRESSSATDSEKTSEEHGESSSAADSEKTSEEYGESSSAADSEKTSEEHGASSSGADSETSAEAYEESFSGETSENDEESSSKHASGMRSEEYSAEETQPYVRKEDSE